MILPLVAVAIGIDFEALAAPLVMKPGAFITST
jgi:hypothetical protein